MVESMMPSSLPHENNVITVVSGMPRSGTSMMMQMLAAAGLEIHSDGQRGADADNPKGYFELDATKRLGEDAAFLAECVGRVVKIVGPLLGLLPTEYRYRVIFMERDIRELLDSQEAMIEHGGRTLSAEPPRDTLEQAFRGRIESVKRWLEDSDRFAVCYVSHRFVVESPIWASLEVAKFLEVAGDPQFARGSYDGHSEIVRRMASAVDEPLYRHRR
jgi:hypothetical protein